MENLKEDWCIVKKIEYQTIDKKVVPSKDITKTSISKAEFKQLMSSDMTERDLDALFSLYDYDHDGTITWREYICVITLLMAGSTMEKVKLIFNCFDEDGNGVLTRDEFRSAALKFSDAEDENVGAFCDRVFKACDVNGDGEVSYKEFYTWVTGNQDEFDKFAGVLNILPADDA
eukprot:TRINITY_DN3084_c0_g1_i1.p1 TRINITY_DN3084_c0_g1~~TRINITY_DN3084_c0_g1_i1.p1  ORF type:complete len:174 (-),score=25.60 TRINITY_DN3084_c0_g1_i1:120-641(-)